MKLPFEEWTLQKGFSVNVQKLFKESFICYRNTAYRASLLFNYLAFLTILKEVIIKSVKPTAITQSRWDDIILKLQNDDTWEKRVFEEIVNGSSPIFNITEDLRQQVKFWKDRRNDCAHFKSNEIESHHIESFWSFLKSNLSKITVEGGKDSLLNKFEKHFDPTFTPPNADYSYLIKEIEESVGVNELTDFWSELLFTIDRHPFLFYNESTSTRIVNKVFELCTDATTESLTNFLKQGKYDLFIVFLYPDKVNFLKYSPMEIREIWRTRIWNNKPTALGIYSTLLRNSLIPALEINEANYHVVEKATDCRPNDNITHLSLASHGFGDAVFDVAIHDKRLKDWYTWVNPRADMIAYYIEKYPLKEETVEVICEMYTRGNYSFWLSERIIKIFTDDASKKAEFLTIVDRKDLDVPALLT